MAVEAGFVTSVDLVVGLPGESLSGFATAIESLAAVGVHGVSLYVLNRSARNAKFLRKVSALPDILDNYLFFQSGDQMLSRLGYVKSHFTHYARPEDKNLYFRHRLRGEDLIALGPSADGVLGDLHYRNLDWPDWAAHITDRGGIEGVLRETFAEIVARPATSALMCGEAHAAALCAVGADALLARWLGQCLLLPSSDAGLFYLTGNGSWLVGEMMEAVERFAKRVECGFTTR